MKNKISLVKGNQDLRAALDKLVFNVFFESRLIKLIIVFTSYSLLWQTFFTCDADAESTEPSDECEYY